MILNLESEFKVLRHFIQKCLQSSYFFGRRVLCVQTAFFPQKWSSQKCLNYSIDFRGRFVSPKLGRFFHKNKSAPAPDSIKAVCRRMRRLDGFLYEAKNSRSKLKNSKSYKAVDVLSKAYPMVPLSCRSNLADRYL